MVNPLLYGTHKWTHVMGELCLRTYLMESWDVACEGAHHLHTVAEHLGGTHVCILRGKQHNYNFKSTDCDRGDA
jgi:hypothetical protein